MRKRDKERWIKALRSGKYKQAIGALGEIIEGEEHNCCLGVACRVFGLERDLDSDGDFATYDKADSVAPMSLSERLGISVTGKLPTPVKIKGKKYSSLVGMNDGGLDFNTIADVIEQQF